MAADDDVYPMILPTARSRPAETPVLTHPALQRRTALRDRRPRAVRRHTGRVATRFAVLLTGDVVAIFIARAVALWLAAETVRGAEAFSEPRGNDEAALVIKSVLGLPCKTRDVAQEKASHPVPLGTTSDHYTRHAPP